MGLMRSYVIAIISLSRTLPHEWKLVRGLLRPLVRSASKYPGDVNVICQNVKFSLNLRGSLFQQSIAFFPRHIDRKIVTLLKDKLRHGDVFFDIGSHAGFYAIIAASLKNEGVLSVALEADPINVKSIEKNVKLNGYENRISVISGAAGQKGTVELNINEENRGSNSVVRQTGRHSNTVKVESDTLLGWLKSVNHYSAHIMKLDIEGCEYDVLKDYFLEQKTEALPRLIIVEVNEGFFGAKSIVELIEGKNYLLVLKDGDNHVFEKVIVCH